MITHDLHSIAFPTLHQARMASAVGEGAMAVKFVHEVLKEM